MKRTVPSLDVGEEVLRIDDDDGPLPSCMVISALLLPPVGDKGEFLRLLLEYLDIPLPFLWEWSLWWDEEEIVVVPFALPPLLLVLSLLVPLVSGLDSSFQYV